MDSFFFILCRKSFKDFLKNDFKVELYNKIFEYVNNLESRLHHFHFTDMSNYTRVSLFKVLVLWFSLLFSALCSHSILTADLINYQMTVYKVFHRASFMRLIQVLNWAAASSRVSYRLSHVTAAIHQPCCISTTLFLFVAQYDASLVLLSSPPPRSSVLLSVPLPPFPLLLPSLI